MTSLVIACGALARELKAVLPPTDALRVHCLPADLHNRPQEIPKRVEALLAATHGDHDHRFVAYADCGTAGQLDRVLARYPGVERLPGAHCYAAFAGEQAIEAVLHEQPGTFFLTDFMVRHFERLVIRGLGLDRFPELRDVYFGNYTRVLYLAQIPNPALREQAEVAARRLGLPYEYRHTGLGALDRIARFVVPDAA